MNKLSEGLPLASIFPLEEVPRVELYLDEPLVISRSSKRRQLSQQILALVQGIDLFVRKEQQSHTNLTENITAMVQELEALIRQLGDGDKTVQEFLKDTGLETIYSRVGFRLGTNVETKDESGYDTQEHFLHMALMNQVVSIALQLQKDTASKDHQYIAHQLALLYQGLNQVGGGFLKYKSKIETHFDKIKAMINEGDVPQLNDEQKAWLMNITSEVIVDALFKLRPMRPASQPLVDFLNSMEKTTR